MKITVTINGAEIVVDARTPADVLSASSLIKDLISSIPSKPKGMSEDRQTRQRTAEADLLHMKRVTAIEFTLATNGTPMNAPEIAKEVRELEPFQTKSGDPVHIVRRVLASEDRFQKTVSGLFKLKDGGKADEQTGEEQPVILHTNNSHETQVKETPRRSSMDELEADEARYLQERGFARPPASRSSIPVNYVPIVEDDMDDPFADN